MISIIIPTYNRSQLLIGTLESLKTIWGKVEIVIVNDSSSDDTEKRVKQFIAKNNVKNIKCIKNIKNQGTPKAFNIGIKNSSNDFCFLMADDNVLLDPENVINFFKEYENKNCIIATKLIMETKKPFHRKVINFIYRMVAETFAGEIYNYNGNKQRIVKYCSGAFGFNRNIGILFDEKSYIKNYFRTETEFQKRAREKGIEILYFPNIRILDRTAKHGGLRQKKKRDVSVYYMYNHIIFLRLHFKISKYYKFPFYFLLSIVTHPHLTFNIIRTFNKAFKIPIDYDY
jgi:glycosyltransferase involved in cell wall biosynthesis